VSSPTAAVAPAGYDPHDHPPFAVTTDVVVCTIRDGQLSVLLIQRGGEPYAGRWALPGGFVGIDEDVDDAASRELAEESGLDVVAAGGFLEQLRTYGAPRRDPRMRVVSVAYVAVIPAAVAVHAGSDATAARWWPIAGLDLGDRDGDDHDGDDDELVTLAFDHAAIVAAGVERVRSKLEYTSLATSFLGDTFTLSELRRVYETVWGHPIDTPNFRRKVLGIDGLLVPAGDGPVTHAGPGRPAQRYRRGHAHALHPPLLRTA
jgi:8-oxo-dGTP diphosphatase